MNEAMKPIAVIGAAGLTGRPLVAELERRGVPVRALVRTAEQAASFRDARIADLGNSEELAGALEGAQAIYYIPPSFNDREIEFATALIAAAQKAGVSRFIYHSVIHSPTPAMPHHARKAVVELMLRESPLVWTIIQPTMYTQTCLTFFDKAADEFTPPYAIDQLFNPIDLADLTEATANILTGENYEYGTFELSGSERLTPVEMAEILNSTLRRDIVFRQEETQSFAIVRAKRRSFSPRQTEELAAMYRHYGDFGLPGNGRVLEMVLGRSSTQFAAVLQRDWA